jgi:hypothetical protein
MPGSRSGVAHAIIEAATSDRPPGRLLLDSDAYELVTAALRARLDGFERRRDAAFAADAEHP